MYTVCNTEFIAKKNSHFKNKKMFYKIQTSGSLLLYDLKQAFDMYSKKGVLKALQQLSIIGMVIAITLMVYVIFLRDSEYQKKIWRNKHQHI